uniref:AAA+ ATPase domain-containing protein n=1 Tax=viral metagenome TaxID=1070528 RepID=A0A6C0DV02_9ZZZZ
MIELSQEQKYALQKFKQNQNLFITGAGGTGKTKLIHYLVEYAYSQKKKIQICALTGCAAVLLGCNAKTIHSWSGIRLARGEIKKIIESVLRNRKAVNNWKRVHILVIDEVSMLSKKIFELLDIIGRKIRNNSLPFGGIQIVCTGDFFQLPPVGTPGEPDTVMFCFESERWLDIFPIENHIELKTMFRQKDPIYINILLQIRNGSIDEYGRRILKTRVNIPYDLSNNNGCIPTKLYPTRDKVEYMNETMFESLDEEEYHFTYSKKIDCRTIIENGKSLSAEQLEKCRKLTEQEIEFELDYLLKNTSCFPLLKLKKGASVLCTINLDLDNNICNGSQGVIIDIVESNGLFLPVVKFSNGVTQTFQPHYWQSEEYPSIAIGQFPLCLAWAMTIHKMQGSTLDMAEMDIGNSVFECGQSYVALSRIKSMDGLYLTAFNPDKIRTNPTVVEFYSKIPTIPEGSREPIDFTRYEMKEEENTDVKIVYI